TIGVVNSGVEMTVNAGAGDDTITVGSLAPRIVDGISGSLIVNGEGGTDTLNVEDTGDTNPNVGTLDATTITGLGMGGSITYGTVETLNIDLGMAGDTFTIEDTFGGTTTVNGNNGNDTINIEAISGATTANGGNDSDTFNVGANVQTVNGIS